MKFLSYAQNCEDLMLFRALGGVDRGFYIDVGAQDPVEDSVTKAFYERGWRGINIDPANHWHRKLVQDRPRDINLRVAASDHRGKLRFYDVAETGLSTANPDFAVQYRESGRKIAEYEVECRTLDEICAEYSVEQIHFLKIDTEGAEAAVLRGLSLGRTRPWVIVIEAMLPNSQIPAWQEWHPLLDANDYSCVYEDGMNRFYLAHEHRELKEAFRFPPNIMDDFVQRRTEAAMDYLHGENVRREAALVELSAAFQRSLVSQGELERGVAALRNENERRESALVRLREVVAVQQKDVQVQEAEIARQRSEIDRLHGEIISLNSALIRQREEISARDQIIIQSTQAIQAIRASTSWRVTAPLRRASAAAASARRSTMRGFMWVLRPPARLARPVLRRLAQIEWLHAFAKRLVKPESRIAHRARWFLFGPPTPSSYQPEPIDGGHMTRSALRVLGEINKRRHVQGDKRDPGE